MTRVYCQECGHQSPRESKYCSKCGALLEAGDTGAETTVRFSPDAEEREPDTSIHEIAGEGVSLVVRSGGDMTGESFKPETEKTTIGRHPSSDIFLDDITVSRNHALLIHRDDAYFIQDQGSLNGTYVNHVRVETQKLSDGDQVQIGKYKLTFIER